MSCLYYTNLMWSVNRSQLKLNAPSSQELAYRTRRVVTALVSSQDFDHETTRNSTNKSDKLFENFNKCSSRSVSNRVDKARILVVTAGNCLSLARETAATSQGDETP